MIKIRLKVKLRSELNQKRDIIYLDADYGLFLNLFYLHIYYFLIMAQLGISNITFSDTI